MNGKREYGDYQTPEYFSLAICQYLKNERHLAPSVIIEPTCGIGNFIKSSLIFNASQMIGIEINPEYCNLHWSALLIVKYPCSGVDFRISSANSLKIISSPGIFLSSKNPIISSLDAPSFFISRRRLVIVKSAVLFLSMKAQCLNCRKHLLFLSCLSYTNIKRLYPKPYIFWWAFLNGQLFYRLLLPAIPGGFLWT